MSITNTSGVAGIAIWVNEYRSRNRSAEKYLPGVTLDKTDPLIHRIYEWVMTQYDEGRVTMITDSELEEKYTELTASDPQVLNTSADL